LGCIGTELGSLESSSLGVLAGVDLELLTFVTFSVIFLRWLSKRTTGPFNASKSKTLLAFSLFVDGPCWSAVS